MEEKIKAFENMEAWLNEGVEIYLASITTDGGTQEGLDELRQSVRSEIANAGYVGGLTLKMDLLASHLTRASNRISENFKED